MAAAGTAAAQGKDLVVGFVECQMDQSVLVGLF